MKSGPLSLLMLCVILLTGCMKWDYGFEEEEFKAPASGLFILSEGNFQYGNSSLCFYNPVDNEVWNDVFFRANGMKLGDVAHSMTMHDGKGWIVVNNSHVIFAIDPDTFKEKRRIENLTSPRYIHFVSDEKAYVSQIWDNRIIIVDPRKYEITGYISVPGMTMESGSTEQMVQVGKYVYCNCWSYQNRIIKIDTETDRVVGEVEVGIQPVSIVADRYGRLWTLTDGGYEGSTYGNEAPALYRIDPDSLTIEMEFPFAADESPRALITDASGEKLYWINGGVWRMDVSAERMPVKPFIDSRDTRYYGMTICPENGQVYVADAVDYQQQGAVYRYTPDGELMDEFYVGVTPGAFCWK